MPSLAIVTIVSNYCGFAEIRKVLVGVLWKFNEQEKQDAVLGINGVKGLLMEIETKVVNSVTIAKLCDTRLDAAQALRFKEGLRELSDGGANHIVLDMTDIAFMDSSGLGAVVTVMKQMGREKTLELASLTPAVGKVFALTRMDKIFTIYASVDDAVSKDFKAAG